MKFDKLPDQLPATAAELEELAAPARDELSMYLLQAKVDPAKLSADDVARVEYLTAEVAKVDAAIETAATAEAEHDGRLASALEAASKATAPKPEPVVEPAPEPEPEAAAPAADEGGADVVAEAEAATAEAAAPVAVTAAAKPTPKPVPPLGQFANGDVPAVVTDGEPNKRWALTAAAPNFAEFGNQKVDTAVIAAGISAGGQFTGLNPDAKTVIARMDRPQGQVYENVHEFLTELDRIGNEIPGHGKVTADRLVAAGGWCAPSEQLYDFCETPAAAGLLSLPEMPIKRGGVIFPAEPDFTALQTGFHFTETELEADSGSPNYTPTAIKNFVEIPCPPDMVEYRLEAIGWAVKSGILQKRAWPELIKKFLDEFMVAHQYRVSALSVTKILAQSSAAKVVPNDVVLGATTSILNGLHIRARNLQLATRKPVIEGIAPIWFRDVLRADLAGRSDLAGLDVTDADVDRWLAARGIYLQYEGRWQSLTTGQPGNENTSWWPGSVDVVLYPAGTFWRSLQNVITLGVQFPIDMLQQNRQMEGFVEDEFQVGKRCYPSHLIRIPLCVNGAVGAREHIDCSTEYATTRTATVSTTGVPTGGGFTLKFSANGTPSASIAYNAAAATVDTTLTAIDDNVTAAGDITAAGGALPTAVQVTYPARLGDLQLGTNSLTGGTSPAVVIA